MKKLTLITAGLLGCIALFLLNFQLPSSNGPENPELAIAPFEAQNTPGWYQMKEDQKISTQSLIENHKTKLGLSAYDELRLIRTQKDDLGFEHHRYQQYHRGVKVDAGLMITHGVNGTVNNFNGQWVQQLDKVVSPKLSANQAVQKALQYAPAQVYLWEVEGAQKMLQKLKKDPQASFYPKAELVWFDPSFSRNPSNYRLAYSLEVQAQAPLFRFEMYVDAQTGELLYQLNALEHGNSLGAAFTKYSGNRPIITDSIGVNSFRLREVNRGGSGVSIFTLDLNQSTNYGSATDFVDDDNFWANFNPQLDEAATDAHWAAEMTHDYWLAKHNYRGVDGQGMGFTSYIHYDTLNMDGEPSREYVNAFWNGAFASFGDGDENTSPLTDIDVVSHEFGHGIDQFSSDLRYRGESGALDESYADIWGATVEFWAKPGDGDWYVGEDSDKNGNGLRNMANPKSNNDPDTYGGEFWGDPDCDNPGDQDNCYVHSNSGVGNHWYYLLVEGGSGVNDNDDAYNVPGIGLDSAAQLARRAQYYYLMRDATYADARQAGLRAAEDLYGKCSDEYVTVANTWNAVGVGDGIFPNDVQMTSIMGFDALNCGLQVDEKPTVQVNYRSCVPELGIGDKIPVAAQVDNGVVVRDTFVLTSPLPGLDSAEFTFNTAVPGMETGGFHTLKIWTEFPSDSFRENDTTAIELENIIEQNSDFTTTSVPPLKSDCFLTTQNVSMEVLFLGCDKISAGAAIDMYYRANGGTPVKETTTLPNDLLRGETFDYTFSTPLDLTNDLGTSKIDFWVDLQSDFLNENDTLLAQIARNPYLLKNMEVVTFEDGDNSLDSVYFLTTANSSVVPTSYSRFEEPNILRMSGGDFVSLLSNNQVARPTANNVWANINKGISAQSCFCVDATGMDNVLMTFDLQQAYTRSWQALYGAANPFGSAARVVVNDVQVSDSYFPATLNSDQVVNREVNLDAFANTVFEVCIESRCGFGPEFDAFNTGDVVRIDNVMIEGISVGVKNLTQLSGIQVFPNPSSGSVNITYNENTGNDLQLKVYDVYGRVVESLQQNLQGSKNQQISLEGLTAGTYYFYFTNDKGQRIEKVVLF